MMQFRDIPIEQRTRYGAQLTCLGFYDVTVRTRLMLLRWRYDQGELLGDSPEPPRLCFARWLWETGRLSDNL